MEPIAGHRIVFLAPIYLLADCILFLFISAVAFAVIIIAAASGTLSVFCVDPRPLPPSNAVCHPLPQTNATAHHCYPPLQLLNANFSSYRCINLIAQGGGKAIECSCYH
jgi:hypothetical protein